ncbi:MAG: ubiquinol oxidase subunit II [Rhodanobacter sp.]
MRLLCAGFTVFLSGCSMEVLSPKGDIGMQERTLILTALGLMLIVVVPVIVMTLVFAWRYRSSNTKATYAPKWAHSTAIEVVVWTVPCIIVSILAVIAWRTSYSLDPYKPLESNVKPITVEAVSLDWKWLFIYPDYGVASVNELAMPVNVPVNFKITSGSVMNSFFIPQLGSQIYAMAGMETKLHLIASEEGSYEGLSANYSGAGFSDMHFQAIATSQQGFDDWIKKAKAGSSDLTMATYEMLAKPSMRLPVTYYSNVSPDLFGGIVHQYMAAPAAAGTAPMAQMTMQNTEVKAAE